MNLEKSATENLSSALMDEKQSHYNTALKSISRQSALILFGKLSFQIINFIASIVLARLLGPAPFGRYQLGLVTVQIISIIGMVGFDRGLTRFIPIFNLENIGKTKKLLLDNMIIVSGISTGLALLLFFNAKVLAIYIFHSEEIIDVLKAFSIYVPVLTIFSLGMASLRGFKRADLESFYDNIFSPILFIVLILMINYAGGQLPEVIFARMISRILGIVCIIYFMFKHFARVFTARACRYDFKKYFSYSLPLLLISLIYFAISKINILMLGYFLDSEQVGVYSVLMYLATLSVFGLQAVNAIFAPHISEIYQLGDIESLEKLLKVLTKWIFYFSLFVTALIFVLNQELLMLYGDSYLIGKLSLVILAIGHLVNAFTGSTGSILLMTGKQNWEIFNSVAVLALNVVANIYLIPRWGLDGAAIAFAISISVINLLKVLETFKEFKIHPYNFHYIKGTLAISISAVLGFYLQRFFAHFLNNYILVLSIVIMVMLLIALLLLVIFKFDEEDIFILKTLAQKFNFWGRRCFLNRS